MPREESGSRGSLEIYRSQIRRYPTLNRSEEIRLGQQKRGGSRAALFRLVEGNLRLVLEISNDYRWALGYGIQMSDMVQEGNIGLIEAAERYNPENKFSTYASCWINAHIMGFIKDSIGPFRVPRYLRQEMSRLYRGNGENSECMTSFEEATQNRARELLNSSFLPLDPQGRYERFFRDGPVVHNLEDLEDDPPDILGRWKIERCLERVRPKERYIIEERLKNRSQSEIAEDLGMTKAGVSASEIRTARKLAAMVRRQEVFSRIAATG